MRRKNSDERTWVITPKRNSQATTQYALFPLPPSSALVGISLEPEIEAKKMARVAKESMRVIWGECEDQWVQKMLRTRSNLDICRWTVLPFKLDGHLECDALEDSDRYLDTYYLSLIVKAFLYRNLLDLEHRTIKANVRELLTFQGIPYSYRENIENNKHPDDVMRPWIWFKRLWLRSTVVL